MSSDHKTGNDPESKFSFGVRELRAANVAQKFSVDIAPLKVVDEDRGVDPYNTLIARNSEANIIAVVAR